MYFQKKRCIAMLLAGLVIGKYGVTSREIVRKTGWAPKILRSPPIRSEIIDRIRNTLMHNSKERKKILQTLGARIHQGGKYDNDWTRLTAMGGFKEVGRSCMLLQTPNSRVLLDCGVNVAGQDEKSKFPMLGVPEFSKITDIILNSFLDKYYFGWMEPITMNEFGAYNINIICA